MVKLFTGATTAYTHRSLATAIEHAKQLVSLNKPCALVAEMPYDGYQMLYVSSPKDLETKAWELQGEEFHRISIALGRLFSYD